MENNNGGNFNLGGLILGLGALGFAAYTIAKKVKEEKARQLIDIQPTEPREIEE